MTAKEIDEKLKTLHIAREYALDLHQKYDALLRRNAELSKELDRFKAKDRAAAKLAAPEPSTWQERHECRVFAAQQALKDAEKKVKEARSAAEQTLAWRELHQKKQELARAKKDFS